MRVGTNPLKQATVSPRAEIVAAVITHLPYEIGYHAQRFEVVQTCLNTMRAHTEMEDEVAIYVWDNGSGPALRDWLLYEYQPDYLTLAPNLGKSSARTAILRTFDPKTIVGISDDDIYFYPNWLKPQLTLLKRFPNVGAVSGYPVRTQFKWGTDSTMAWAKKHATLTSGRFIPEQWDRDFCDSVGRKYDFQVRFTRGLMDQRIEYQGMQAYATAHHCQFICYAGRLENIVEWNDEATADERPFDKAIDGEGYLRLTTTERLTRHIGNILDDELREWQTITVPSFR